MDLKELDYEALRFDKNGRRLSPGQYAYRVAEVKRNLEHKLERQSKARTPRYTTERTSDWVGTPTDEDTPPW